MARPLLIECPRALYHVAQLSQLFPARSRADRTGRNPAIRRAHLDTATVCPRSAEP